MRIAYVGTFLFPEGDAGAARVLGIGKALRECGHEVVFLGIEKTEYWPDNEKCRASGNISFYQDFKFRFPGPTETDIWEKLKRQFSIFSGTSIISRLKKEESVDDIHFNAVIAYQAPSILIVRLKYWCKIRCIPLICDAVEWYDAKQLFGGRASPFYWDSELSMRCFHKMSDGVIAISELLADYYRRSGNTAIRIPPLVDAIVGCKRGQQLDQTTDNKRLLLVYAGIPGKKDLLGNVLRGVLRLREKGYNVAIKLIGVSREQVLSCLNGDKRILESLGNGLVLLPRIPRSEVQSELANADFMPLLRPQKRYANAGFPTKIVESLAAGVPVIANLTSDLGKYLQEGRNAFIAHGPTVEDFVDAVERALAKRLHWGAMRDAAKQCVEDYFDYRAYGNQLNIFLESVARNAYGKDLH